MPKPVDRTHRYVRGLDGLRALAVAVVIAFHLGLTWAPGGLLGVGVFFTLSGYLITDLLMGRWERSGSFALQEFWWRRARRLLPAVVVVLLAVTVWVSLLHHGELGGLWGNIGAAAGYFSNWWLVFHHVSYFARFGPPSPLGHLWSLAVEEQFYLVWPWMLLLATRWIRSRWILALAALLGAALSATEMAWLWHPGVDPTRVYDGTDTRAFGLLFGAALAFVWPSRPRREQLRRWNPRLLDAVGVAGLAGIIVMVVRVGQYSPFLYRGGMVLLSVATCAVIAAVVHPRSVLGRVLGMRPVRWVGVRSYGIYLWHYPILVLTTSTLVKPSGLRSATQVLATLVVAALSWRLVEDPIRSGRWTLSGLARWPSARPGHAVSRGLALSGGALAVVTLLTLSVLVPGRSHNSASGLADTTTTVSAVSTGTRTGPWPGSTTPDPTRPGPTVPGPTVPGPRLTPTTAGSVPPPTVASTTPPTTPASRSSCRSVVHIGDSTSESLMSSNYLPDPAQRLDARYRDVGVTALDLQIQGARSIVEHYDSQPSGYDIARSTVASHYQGCWVIALGTNDAADIAVGSNTGAAARITKMMAAIGHQPVLWVDTVSILPSGPYAAANMLRWNQALTQACRTYPNLRIYDWAAFAARSFFTTDGIHYTTPGSVVRAAGIAHGLAAAFPQTGRSAGCIVR